MKSLFFILFFSISSIACNVAFGAAEKLGAPDSQDSSTKPGSHSKLPLDHGPHAVTTPWSNQQRAAALVTKKHNAPSNQVDVANSK